MESGGSTVEEVKKIIIVGAGHRSITYAKAILESGLNARITGVADLVESRRNYTAKLFSLKPEQCFSSVDELVSKGRIADAIINGTMDHQHVSTSIPLLELGYDMLLEKPFAVDEEEMWRLVDCVKKNKNKVMICHVLRYAPFYSEIYKRIKEGIIGDILNIQTQEHVSYHHIGIGYVRGKWRNKECCSTTMLLAKCCHDMDMIMWLQNGARPSRVASFGSNTQFHPGNAPEGAGTRCMVDCSIEESCIYSAKKHYIDHPDRWSFYVWDCFEDGYEATIEEKIHSLETDNIYGKCVYKCDNTTVDHQSVMMEFENGSTATHNMIGGAATGRRAIHIVGTLGEIFGAMEDEKFTIRTINPAPGCEYDEVVVNLGELGDTTGAFGGHGGGDFRLAVDFINFISGKPHSDSCTSIEESIYGHFATYRADSARENGIIEDTLTVLLEKGC